MFVGVLGLIGSGKNTVARRLEEKYGFRRDSFASTLKDVTATLFDWPRNMLEGDTEQSRMWREEVDLWWAEKLGNPHFTPRVALQQLGTDVLRNHFHKDIWLLALMRRYETQGRSQVVISDARFQNEVELIKSAGGTLVRVDRGMKPVWWDVAVDATRGDITALEMMQTKYAEIHQSEWDWAGVIPDYVIDNSGSLEDLHNQIDDLQKYLSSLN